MNELVTPASGILLTPERTGSYDEQSLRQHAAINAFLSPDQICAGVQRALAMRPAELEARGRAARRDYLRERSEFAARAAELRTYLEQRQAAVMNGEAAAAAAAAVRGAAAAVPDRVAGGAGAAGMGGNQRGRSRSSSDGDENTNNDYTAGWTRRSKLAQW